MEKLKNESCLSSFEIGILLALLDGFEEDSYQTIKEKLYKLAKQNFLEDTDMRSIKHWTPTYIINRLASINFRKKYQEDLPCLGMGAIQFLSTYLTKQDTVFEFGSGYSTAWFAKRVKKIISVESDATWFIRVKNKLTDMKNAEIYLINEKTDLAPIGNVSWNYLSKIKEYDKESFDLILNDGYARPIVALQSIDYLKKGGILCWDDFGGAHLLTDSLIPGRLRSEDGVHQITKEFMSKVESWRRVIFDDGVHSCALFFKPYHA